ncbi:MAG: TonB-dependent receptor [Flaviaesturariibacter sp.]|nr:TonB-dependent receptor [Flaviaesturariibacter sp.]
MNRCRKQSFVFQTPNMKRFIFFFLTQTICLVAFSQSDSLQKAVDTLFSKTLTNVVVQSQKRLIEVKTDRVVFNPEALPAAAGQNVLELLRSVPGVVVTPEEAIQMGGKNGVTVLIDGRNLQLAPEDLAQLLKSITGDVVKSIDIIANPSAKYDAAGNAGIIDIRLKKSLVNGVKGSLSGSWVQSDHARQNASAAINWRKNRWSLGLNAGANNGLQYVTADNERQSSNTYVKQHSLEKDRFSGYNLRANADYKLSPASTLGFLWMRQYKYTRMDNGSQSILQQPFQPDTTINTRSQAPFGMNRDSWNSNYAFRRNNMTWDVDADYTNYISSVDNGVENQWQKGSVVYDNKAFRNATNITIRLASLKVDFSQKWRNGQRIENGAKWQRSLAQSRLFAENLSAGNWIADSGKSNQFRFRETIAAAYGNWFYEGKKWSLMAGLRLEASTIKGAVAGIGETSAGPDTAYINLFPSVAAQYQLSEKNSLGLNLSRRIDRPSYQDQNPFVYVLDAFNIEQGNPYLQPQFTNTAELTYAYKNTSFFKVRYSKTVGLFEQLTYATAKGTVQIPQNAGSRQMLNFVLSTPLTITKNWLVYLNAEPYFHQYRVQLSDMATNEKINRSSWGFNGYISNTVSLKNNWRLELNGWYNFQNKATIYTSKPLGSANLGVQKKTWQQKATLKFAVTDLFNTQSWSQTANTENLQLHTYRKWESRNITVGFSWRWGNNKIKSSRDRQIGNAEALGRIKTGD